MARLSVSGANVLDPAGKPIVLRGYNWGQWGTALPQDAADNVAQGANVVRLPLRWWGDWKDNVDSRKTNAPGHIDPAHLALLDQTIAWATAQHLWVVLFVDSNYGQGANGGTDNFWTDAPMKQEFVEVWQFLVTRYRDTPSIGAWEILPEPRATGVSDADTKAFYDSIIPVIRALDPKTPIVVGPNDAYNFNRLDAAYTTIDSQIIYTADYFIFSNELAHISDIKSFIKNHDAPVWVNQIGIQSGDTDASTKAQSLLSALAKIDVGWAWWTYRVQTTDPLQHGIWYQNPKDTSQWLVKPDWYQLLGNALSAP